MNRQNPNSTEPHAGLTPPQFNLRSLLYLVAAIATFFAVSNTLNSAGMILFVIAVAMIGLHVLGNSIGMKLRENASSAQSDGESLADERISKPQADDFAPVTKLSLKTSLGRPLLIATILSMLVGAVVGFFLLNWIYPNRLELPAIGIGLLAGAALGGFWGFWTWSLFQVFISAWWQAHQSARPETPKSRRRS